MKKLLSLFLSVLWVISAFGQGTQPLKRVRNGTIDRKAAVRNITQYPLTTAGNAAFLQAVNAGTVPIINRPGSTTTTSTTTTATALALLDPAYNCATKQFSFSSSGGNGTAVEYKALGITDWTTNRGPYTVNYDNNSQPIQMQTRQGGASSSKSFSIVTFCGNSSPPTGTTTTSGSTVTSGGRVGVGFDYYGFAFQPVPSSARPSNNKITLQQNGVKVERWLDYGGAICHVSENGGPNMVNNFDHGRQIPVSLYGGPLAFNPSPGFNAGGPGYVAGGPAVALYNPLEAGDFQGNASEILDYGYDATTGTHYTRSRVKSFFLTNYVTGVYFETWTRFVSANVVRTWYKISINRNNDQNSTAINVARYTGYTQEFPIGYVNDQYYKMSFHNGGNIVEKNLNNTGEWIQSIPTGQNWFAVSNSSGRGFGLHGPHIWSITGRVDGSGNGGEFGDRSVYVANLSGRMLDPVGTLYTTFDIVVGTPNDVQSWAATNTDSRPNGNVPDYNFSTSRQNFWIQNGTGLDENTTAQGELIVNHEQEQTRLIGPNAAFSAVSAQTLYVKMRNTTNQANLRLLFRKPGQSESDVAGQQIDFNVPNDGQYYTRALSVSGNPGWSGQISYFTLQKNCTNYPYSGGCPENTPASGQWGVKYIGINNPN